MEQQLKDCTHTDIPNVVFDPTHVTDHRIRETCTARPSMVDLGKRRSARIRDEEGRILRHAHKNPGNSVHRTRGAYDSIAGFPGTSDAPVSFGRGV
jgi:hypothetical protein